MKLAVVTALIVVAVTAERRTWVEELRAPEAIRPEVIGEALGQLAPPPADVPAPAGPSGPDDPHGDRPLTPAGPARDAPRSIEPQGSSRLLRDRRRVVGERSASPSRHRVARDRA